MAVPVSRAVVALSWAVAALAGVAAAVGLFTGGGGGPFDVVSVRGQAVRLYGHGLYHDDTLFTAGLARGTDAVVLFVGVPLLVLAVAGYRRGSPRAALVLAGVLGFVLYVYASVATGTVAYNRLFLVYVALLSASLYAFGLLCAALARSGLPGRLAATGPRRGPAVLLLASGAVTAVVWGVPLVSALLRGGVPDRLDTYTTPVTYALDLAVITPATVVAGLMVLRGRPMGHLAAVVLLVVEALLAPMVLAQTVGQAAVGVRLAPGEAVGPVVGFLVLSAVAAGFLVAILRRVPAHAARTGAPF